MEEVPAHMHPEPIVSDVLSRQHEHRSGLIWTFWAEPILVLQYGSPHFFGYKVKNEPLEAWILRAFIGSETDDDLILRTREFIFLLIGGHMLPNFSGNLVHAVVHGSIEGCTTDWGGLSLSTDLGVVVYIYIEASADYGDSGRPSCSSWHNMVHII
ncbi:hypothetical protein M9H77_25624 [Catharanthus roseus]|uniref:Uncharacterized protein n=1 Tax=Catharanthus roseus TaxID=4058 RepID=A0ACC0A7U0_CATRO|nr:hypothetical protein M9H77_25624 [Catharanthus roseus]